MWERWARCREIVWAIWPSTYRGTAGTEVASLGAELPCAGVR